jgi:ADP-ribosyl-[dinitrogen reductase] hydrolase
MNLSDRITGCILGGAIGDAFGTSYEGQQNRSLDFSFGAQKISDDTQLTLATCEAIIKSHGQVDPSVIANVFARWFSESRITGIGASTYKALTELSVGGHWALVGNKGERAAGNGSAMRIAPLAFCLDPANPEDRRTIRDVSRITHHNEEAYVGALALLSPYAPHPMAVGRAMKLWSNS